MRGSKFTDEWAGEVQRAYHAAKGTRGIIASLARKYGVDRRTIDQALSRTLRNVHSSPQTPSSERVEKGSPISGVTGRNYVHSEGHPGDAFCLVELPCGKEGRHLTLCYQLVDLVRGSCDTCWRRS